MHEIIFSGLEAVGMELRLYVDACRVGKVVSTACAKAEAEADVGAGASNHSRG